jgi:hypothetical protein
MNSNKKMARIAGFLYLIIFITAGFSEGYVRAGVMVPGDAAATAENIVAAEGLFRLGFAADLVAFLCDLVVSVLLYQLLKPVNKTLSLTAALLRLLAHPAIASVNLLNHYMALQLLDGSDYLAVFSPDQLNALALFFLNVHTVGYLIAGAFFGLHCVLLGYLIIKSDGFPAWLGTMIIIAALGYLINSFGNFLAPGHEELFDNIVMGPAVLAEMSLCLWLLIKGVSVRKMTSKAIVA